MKSMEMIRTLRREFSFLRGNILVLMASWALMFFAMPIPATYYSLFVLELGGTPFILGLIGFASSIALASVQFPGGYLADKYGRRKLIFTMTLGVGLAYLFYALAPSWHFILIGAVVGNLCLIYQPALRAIMADSLPPENRGMGFSFMQIIRIVSVVSPLVAGFLYMSCGLVQGMRVAYFLAVMSFLLAATIRMRLRETVGVTAGRISFIEVVRCYPAAIRESVTAWKLVPRTMLYLFAIFTATSFFAQMCHPYYVVYATEILKIEKFQWALLLTLQSAVMFGSFLPIGKIVDVFGRKKPLVISHLFFTLALPLFIYGDFVKLAICFVLSAVGSSMFIAYQSLEADLVPRELRGKIIGSAHFFGYVLASIGQLTGGLLYGVSPQLPFLLLLFSTIPSAVLTYFLIHEPKKREE